MRTVRFVAGVAGVMALMDTAHAQFFSANKGDLLLGFRKTSASSYELVANIGNVTNFVALSPGANIAVANFSPAQLSAAFSTYNNLQWSVSSAFGGSSAWAGFPASTIWSTVARGSFDAQSPAPLRLSVSAQQAAKTRVYGVGTGAGTISSGLGTTNSNNNLSLVREPSGDTSALTSYIADPSDSTIGDFQGFWYNIENATPANFTAAQRCDLYQSCPDGTTDPTTGLTTGNAYFIGYFELKPDGTMTFTRASLLPPAPVLTIQRSGNDSTISFPTTSGVSYSLFFTNASGLGQPLSTWATSSTTITGDGQTHSFTDTTTDPVRFYTVGAH